MIKLETTKSKTLRFSIDIEGSQETPKINYVIESKPFSYVFEGTVENGKVQIDIPELREYIKAGEYSSRISIVLGENYYEPWTGNVLVETPVEVKINEENIEILEEKKKVNINLQESFDDKPNIIKETKKKFEKKPTISLFNEVIEE